MKRDVTSDSCGLRGRELTRRAFLRSTLGASMLAAPYVSVAQKKTTKIHRVGILFGAKPATTAEAYEVFKQQLREHGYQQGQNIVLEARYGEGKVEQIATFAAELVRLKVDVIVTGNDPTIAAVKRKYGVRPEWHLLKRSSPSRTRGSRPKRSRYPGSPITRE